MYILDVLYTTVYVKGTPRHTEGVAMNLTQEHFTAVFLGSSRVKHTVNVQLFNKLTGGNAINLGMARAGISENMMLLEILLANRNKIDNVYLQIDHINYPRNTANEKMVTVPFLPYIHANPVVNSYVKEHDTDYILLKYVPFYRYAVNDARLGSREVFNTLKGQKLFKKENLGYYPLYGNLRQTESYKLPTTVKKVNIYLADFKYLCAKNNINLILFTGPVCENTNTQTYFEQLFEKHPEIIDLTKGFIPSDFYDCAHTNTAGAEKLTRRLVALTIQNEK